MRKNCVQFVSGHDPSKSLLEPVLFLVKLSLFFNFFFGSRSFVESSINDGKIRIPDLVSHELRGYWS
jgi:hypothetical protein